MRYFLSYLFVFAGKAPQSRGPNLGLDSVFKLLFYM